MRRINIGVRFFLVFFFFFLLQIIIDDCTQVMREFLKEKTTFDYVINDLTDVVIRSEEQDGEQLVFILIIVY